MTTLPDTALVSGASVSSGFSGISGFSVSSGTAVFSGNADISLETAIGNILLKLIFCDNAATSRNGAAVGTTGTSVAPGFSTDGVSAPPELYPSLISGKSKSDTALPSAPVVTVPSLVPASTIFSPSILKMSCFVKIPNSAPATACFVAASDLNKDTCAFARAFSTRRTPFSSVAFVALRTYSSSLLSHVNSTSQPFSGRT